MSRSHLSLISTSAVTRSAAISDPENLKAISTKTADLKFKLARIFPKHCWIAEPIASNGASASVTCQISDRKRCTVAAVAGGFEIELTLGDRQWAGWKDYREFESVLWTLKLHLAWFEQVA